MLQYSSVQKRLYCRHFSINIYFLASALVLFLIAMSPIGAIKAERAINGTLSLTINYFALLLFALGFRGITSSFVTFHKLMACLLGMFPTMFLGLLCFGGGMLLLFSIFLRLPQCHLNHLRKLSIRNLSLLGFLFIPGPVLFGI